MADRRTFLLQGLGAAAAAVAPGWTRAFVDSVDQPAIRSYLAARKPLLAVARAGRRFVAAGLRGTVVFSDDGGRTWTQGAVPVSSDLVALSFPTDSFGWAVGHGGVVLHSSDGGATWTRQFDGRQAAQVAIDYYSARAAADSELERFLAEEQSLADGGGTQPFLGVHFEDERVGYVVGTFNRIFRTEDGGRSWEPWMHRTDNPRGLHFNAIAGCQGQLYLAGEQGSVWRFDAAGGRFVALTTGYIGTLFGLLPLSATTLLAFGMRGSLFRTANAGANWQRVGLSSLAGVTCGTVLDDGTVVLLTQLGLLEASHDQGRSFVPIEPSQPMAYYGVAAGEGDQLIVAGAEGIRLEMVR